MIKLFRKGGLPQGFSDEKRSQGFHVEGGLLGFSHFLDDAGERKQVPARQAQNKVVVVSVEAVTGQTNVLDQTGVAEPHADASMLEHDFSLLFPGKMFERRFAPHGIPHGPGPIGVA